MQKFTAQELLEYALKSGKSVSLKNGYVYGYGYVSYIVGIVD